MQLLDLLPQLSCRTAQVCVRSRQSAVFILQLFQLVLQTQDMLLFAIAKGALRGSVLCAAALERAVSAGLSRGGWDRTYGVHIRDSFFLVYGS